MPTSLHDACMNGELSVVKDLIENQGVSVDATDKWSRQLPIHLAARFGHLKIVEYLLDKLAKTTIPDAPDYHLLVCLSSCNDDEKKKKILEYIYHNFEKCCFEDGTTQLHVAAALGNLNECQEHKDQLLIENQTNYSPLYFSFLYNQLHIIQSIYSPQEKFDNINKISDEEKRILANVYCVCAKVETINQNHEKGATVNQYVIQTINALEVKTDQDMRLLVQAYKNYYANMENVFGFKRQEAADISQKIIDTLNKIKEKIDRDKRDLSQAYSNYSEQQYQDKNYLQAVDARKMAIKAFIAINEKTDEDKHRLEEMYEDLAGIYERYGDVLFANKHLHEAAEIYEKSLKVYENIKDIIDKNLIEISISNLKLAKIYQSLPSHPNRIPPVVCYKNSHCAVHKMKNSVPCRNLIDIYTQWETYYSPHTLGRRFVVLGRLAFTQFNADHNFAELFMQIYHEIIDSRNHNVLIDWLPLLMQLMEMLLKLNSSQHQPLTSGVQFLRADQMNLKFFETSLKDLKSLNLFSLAQSLEHNTVIPIVLFKRMNALETTIGEFQKQMPVLERENAALKTEMAELKLQIDNAAKLRSSQFDQKLPPISELLAANSFLNTAAVGDLMVPSTTATRVTETVATTSSSATLIPDSTKIPRRLSEKDSDTIVDHSKRQRFT